MKTLKIISVLLIAITFLASNLTAQNSIAPNDPIIKAKYSTIEANLLEGLKSDIDGLRISCAYYLGDIKSEKAVIPLMKILREDNCYGARIVAALSLIKIDNEQSVYMVKRTALFNEQEGVRKMSEKFYLSHLWKKYLEQNPDKVNELAYAKF